MNNENKKVEKRVERFKKGMKGGEIIEQQKLNKKVEKEYEKLLKKEGYLRRQRRAYEDYYDILMFTYATEERAEMYLREDLRSLKKEWVNEKKKN